MPNETFLNVTEELINVTSAETSFLAKILDPVVLLFVMLVLLVAVITIFAVRSIAPVSNFLYANARIKARSNYNVEEPLLISLMEAKSLKEFKSMLRDTIYAEEIDKAKDNLRSIHAALEKGFVESILELVKVSPETSKPLFNAYLMLFEAKILKIIYKARLMDVDVDESLIYSVGNLNENLLKHLLGTGSVADIAVVMEQTAYADLFKNKYNSLEEFEAKLDEFVFRNLLNIVKKTRIHDSKYIIEILNKKMDIENILALLKLRIRDVEKDKQKAFLINNDTELALRFDKLIRAETLNEFVQAIKGLPYYEVMSKALEEYEKNHKMSYFEIGLYRYFKKFVQNNELSHTLGPYPLFSYLIGREIEQRNLFIISKSIELKLNPDKIKELIV